jgi:hypothetical protein
VFEWNLQFTEPIQTPKILIYYECLCIDIRLQSIGGSNGGDILGFLGVAERAGDDRGLGGRRSWLGGVRLFAQRTRFGGTQVGHDFNSHQVVHECFYFHKSTLDCCGRLLCRRRVRRLISGSGIGCWALSLFEVLSLLQLIIILWRFGWEVEQNCITEHLQSLQFRVSVL